jgi:hypothetical protein
MTKEEYQRLSVELQELAKIVPLKWGAVQNNSNDSQIDMFKINSFDQLEKEIQKLSDNDKNYLRRRWFLWKCSQCDEYIFQVNQNVRPNPNPRDQSYDIEFNNDPKLRFDIKGTVIPKKFRVDIEAVLKDPKGMLRFFYDEQSKGVRNKYQNRLFLVHHSYIDQDREMYLRCQWDLKAQIYSEYCSRINVNGNFYSYNTVLSDVIFIVENLDKTFTWKFFAV